MSDLAPRCANCNKSAAECSLANLQQCSRCKTTEYCGRDCQKADWKTHKKICAQQANANAGDPPSTIHSTSYSAPRLKTLEQHVPNPFTLLDEGTYLRRRPEKDVYRLLIDAFRMRSEDDMKLENKPMPNSIYTGKPSSIEPFKKFLSLAATRKGLLPAWWTAEHQRGCEKFAESGEWKDVRKKVTKAQMIQHYGDDKAPMQLRMLAEAVYGVGPMNQNGAGMQEEVIIEYILDLDQRGFAPTYAAVRDIADKLLAARGGGQVGVQWPRNFVKRTDRIMTRFNRAYGRQRALCEDSLLVKSWLELVEQTKAKYGICDEDAYNFDEAGFMMGKITTQLVVTGSERRGRPKAIQPGNREWVTCIAAINAAGWTVPPFLIFAGQYHLSAWYEEPEIPRDWAIAVSDNGWTNKELGVEWLKHFDAYTKTRVVGARRLLILDGHSSHHSLEFRGLCKENNIYTLSRV
ncbi:hypothetical protein PTT_06719 [Pyrenophora teres f. teres 0-1]|uniref:Uncharacterized protein n=1 Tax=Pyrenophora teres f. teres (strain 0-1) TaxID=861557 RepID=E3RG26_PYRTT|nr:hypothetical protein PTT_06719 [Pyrenophora teres f. teres 0-1]